MSGRRDIFGVLIPSVTIGLFTVLIVTSLLRLLTIERDMRIDATQNMLWVVTRAQVSSLQLQEAASMRVEGVREGASIDRKFNNFLGHYKVLNHGPQRRQMEEMRLSDALDRVEARQAELERLITTLSVGDAAALARIREILQPYDTALARAGNKAVIDGWNKVGTKLDHSKKQVWAIFVALTIIAIVGTGMTLHLIVVSKTARSRARLLEHEKAFSQLLVSSSSEGIIATDLDLYCTLWNDAASALFGLSAAETLRRPIAEAGGFFTIERVQGIIAQALNGRSRVLDDVPLFADIDAEPVYVDLRCFPLREGTDIIGTILLVSDVTEQHHAKRELAARHDRMEEQVLLRTQELNAALSRERTATEIYRNFAAMISHQFRTPLAIVDSSLQRLVRRAGHFTTEQIVDRSEQARVAISRLVRLVDSTLDVARLDNGQIDKQTAPCDLDMLIGSVVRQQASERPDRTFDYASVGPLIVECDPVHTEHIIANLLSNAAKYALPDTRIRIGSVLDGRHARCRVSNEGRIDPEDRAHLFERYFRGRNAGEKSGVGLGLYMARSLARLQGGEIWLEEESDLVTFIFALPLASHSSPRAVASEAV